MGASPGKEVYWDKSKIEHGLCTCMVDNPLTYGLSAYMER